MIVAHIVCAPLEQRHRHRRLQRIAHHRQVFLEQLVLQVLRAGRDDHLAAGEQRGNQIGESLAGAGARLDTESDGMFKTREDIRHLGKIKQYAKVSDSGDKSGLADVPENAPIWMQVTSTRDNCLGQECPNHKECFVLKARSDAMKADIVVVNHHLFFADVMLRDEGVAELLPACNTVIFDEAHQLPETASLFFGESLSTTL